MHTIYLITTWLHILTAVTWIGAAIFLMAAVVPALRNPEVAPYAARLMRAFGAPLRYLGAGALAMFLITGLFILKYRFGAALASSEFWHGQVGKVVAAKLLLFGIIVLIGVVHDLWLGPRAARAAYEDPDSASTRRLRQSARICGRANLLLGLVMVFLGVVIVRGW